MRALEDLVTVWVAPSMDPINGSHRAEARTDKAADEAKREDGECPSPFVGADLVPIEKQRAGGDAEARCDRDRSLQRLRPALGARGAFKWLGGGPFGLVEDCIRDIGLVGS